MKPILTSITIALLALIVGIHSADAKGKGGGKPPAKKENEVEKYLKEHDKYKNGYIDSSEFPGSKGDFSKWDKNADGHLDHGEIAAMLKK